MRCSEGGWVVKQEVTGWGGGALDHGGENQHKKQLIHPCPWQEQFYLTSSGSVSHLVLNTSPSHLFECFAALSARKVFFSSCFL